MSGLCLMKWSWKEEGEGRKCQRFAHVSRMESRRRGGVQEGRREGRVNEEEKKMKESSTYCPPQNRRPLLHPPPSLRHMPQYLPHPLLVPLGLLLPHDPPSPMPRFRLLRGRQARFDLSLRERGVLNGLAEEAPEPRGEGEEVGDTDERGRGRGGVLECERTQERDEDLVEAVCEAGVR